VLPNPDISSAYDTALARSGQPQGRALYAPLPLATATDAQVAQLVEHVTENHGVGGSIPPLGTNEIKSLGWIV
jgi:hypothetical protein